MIDNVFGVGIHIQLVILDVERQSVFFVFCDENSSLQKVLDFIVRKFLGEGIVFGHNPEFLQFIGK